MHKRLDTFQTTVTTVITNQTLKQNPICVALTGNSKSNHLGAQGTFRSHLLNDIAVVVAWAVVGASQKARGGVAARVDHGRVGEERVGLNARAVIGRVGHVRGGAGGPVVAVDDTEHVGTAARGVIAGAAPVPQSC